MAIKIFLDTNIIIDFFEPYRPEHNGAVQLFSLIESNRYAAFLSESVLNTSACILRKQYAPKALREMLLHLLTFSKIISCNNNLYTAGLNLPGNDIEDAILYQLALESRLDYFVTSDKKDFNKFYTPSLPVVTCNELMKLNSA